MVAVNQDTAKMIRVFFIIDRWHINEDYFSAIVNDIGINHTHGKLDAHA